MRHQLQGLYTDYTGGGVCCLEANQIGYIPRAGKMFPWTLREASAEITNKKKSAVARNPSNRYKMLEAASMEKCPIDVTGSNPFPQMLPVLLNSSSILYMGQVQKLLGS